MTRASEWITSAAHPLVTADPAASLTDLEPLREMVGHASIVGVARGAHGARELSRLTHRVLQFLVDELGFRSLAIETDRASGRDLDAWLHTQRSDLVAPLSDLHSWWRVSEFVDVLHWMHTYNQQRPEDPLRLVGLDEAIDDMSVLERRLATNLLRWREHTGHRILYWSGSHSAVGHARTVAWTPNEPGATSRNAGSYLREQLDTDYVSAGLTFHHGSVNLDGKPVPAPVPPADFTDAVLADTGLERYLLNLRAGGPDSARTVADAPAKLRLIGPRYDPARPASMSGGPLSELFDIVLHTREVTPATQTR